MEYRLDLGLWNQVFAVPCALVDRHLKLAGKEQLQVLLWALRHAGEPLSPPAMAQALGMGEESALEALEYWTDRGLLAESRGELRPVPQPETPGVAAAVPGIAVAAPGVTMAAPGVTMATPGVTTAAPGATMAAPAAPTPAQPSKLPPKKRMVRPDGVQLAVRMEESEGLRFLIQQAEAILGKTLSPAMSSLLLTITDDYGLPPEVTAMLLHYAQEVGKTGTAYIDSVARDWAESGVFSLEAAEAKLQDLSVRRLAWGKVASAAGLPKRSPSKKEEEAALRWVQEWGFTQEMLSAAYDRCADNTGKFSAAYMDRVLESWHAAGVRNPGELAAYEEKKKAGAGKPGGTAPHAGEKSYDIDELERLSFFSLPDNL